MKIKENYQTIEKAYTLPVYENFFTAYALRGAIVDKPEGGRAGLPVNHPISGPVSEPSPLNTRWQYDPQNINISGIL